MKSKRYTATDFPSFPTKHVFLQFCPLNPRFLFILKITVCLLLVSLSGLSFWIKDRFEPVIHIYSDEATIPALLQMIDMIKQPATQPKLLIWNRFRRIDSYAHLSFFSATPIQFNKPLEEQIKAFVNAYPDHRIVFHYNIMHEGRLEAFLNIVPPTRIKAIHAYEDASGWLWWNRSRDKRIGENPSYPVIYHVLKASLFKKEACTQTERCSYLQKLFKDKRVKEINFKKLAKELTQDEKEKLYALTNTNIRSLQQMFSHQPTILYVSGQSLRKNRADFNQIAFLKKACQHIYKKNSKGKPYQWLYKAHPAYRVSSQIIQKTCPGIQEIPAPLPFEILIIADLLPTKTSGYNSSLFFNLDQQDILFFMTRNKKDPYLSLLKELQKIREEQLISLEESVNYIKQDLDFIYVSPKPWTDYLIFMSPQKVCRFFSENACAAVKSKTKEKITIKWDRWGEETFYYQGEDRWSKEDKSHNTDINLASETAKSNEKNGNTVLEQKLDSKENIHAKKNLFLPSETEETPR